MDKKRNRKTFRHSTVSRRDFIKMLGLGSVGMGAAALGLSPQMPFADLDDMMSSELSDRKLPFWVKEVDEPTVEIDWSQIKQSPGFDDTVFMPKAYGGMDKWMARYQRTLDGTVAEIKSGERSVKDLALHEAGWYQELNSTIPWYGTDVKASPLGAYGLTPQELGLPQYEGTPEENSKMLRVAGRLFGAFDMGFVKLDERTKKFLFKTISFEDVEEGYVLDAAESRFVLPDKDLWVITGAIPQSHFMGQFNGWGNPMGHAYSLSRVYIEKMQTFISALGYQAYGATNFRVGLAVPFGVLSGIAEYARTGQMVSPVLGNSFRTVILTITDLPLATTKPIDAGILEFCKTCKKCAEECPAGAISMNDEPEWITEDTHQRPYQQTYGVKGYFTDAMKCVEQMYSQTPHCGFCQNVCPFNKFDNASLHQIINGVIGTTPVANSLIRTMDDVFGYGMKDAEESNSYNLWEMDPWDVPLYGLDRV